MTDEAAGTELVPANLDVTLSIPMETLLQAYTQKVGRYTGDPDDFEEEPPVVLDVIGERAAQIIAKQVGADVRKMAQETLKGEVAATVAATVAEAVTAPVQVTNTWGEPTGKTTTLRDLIVTEARTWLTKPSGDLTNFGRGTRTNLQAVVDKAVDEAIKADLDAALKEARAGLTQRLRDRAAEALAATVAAVAKGL